MPHFIWLLGFLFILSGCAQTQLAAHAFKNVLPSSPKSVGSFKVGTPYKIKGKWYRPKESYDLVQTGIASWYGKDFHNKPTANGEIYDRFDLTAAHKTLQMPSLIKVTNLENGKSLVLRVNDRGPFARGRILDVSERGAELLGFKEQGTARIKLEVLGPESQALAQAAKDGKSTAGTEIAYNRNGRLPDNYNIKTPTKPIKVAQTQKTYMPERDVAKITKVSKPEIFVQTASFSDKENARKVAQQLSYVHRTRVKPTLIKGQQYYRVQVGPLENVNKADIILSQAIDRGYYDALIVLD